MDIDDEKVYQAIPLTLQGYKEYLRQVDLFLDKLENNPSQASDNLQ